VSKKKRLVIISVVLGVLLLAGLVYMAFFYRPIISGELVYTDDTKKALGNGECTEETLAELEKQYDEKLSKNDLGSAGQARYDQAMCATYASENEKALEYLNGAKKHFEKAEKKVELERVTSSIDFLNQRLERAKNPPTESTEDVPGGT
jgi:flagellar basal body-associated protein FliL